MMLYAADFKNVHLVSSHESLRAEQTAFTVLSSVCSYWRQTLIGWTESPTRHYVKHKLKLAMKKLVKRK